MSVERKPAGQSWESFIERRMREAMEAGAFDNLPGLGRPIPDIDEPWNENSWLRKKLKCEQVVLLPPILEARLRSEKFLEQLPTLPTESEVRKQAEAVNQFIREAHYSHIAGPAEGVRALDVEVVVSEWKRLRGESA